MPELIKPLPEPTLRRLPRYLHLVRTVNDRRTVVSSAFIGERLGLDAIQVRKDLQWAGIVGRPKIGYEVQELILKLENLLGFNNVNQAFLVGAGNLGSALMGHKRFSVTGFEIVAAFDRDPKKIGTQLEGRPILPIEKMANLVRRMHVLIGVLAVPAESAQEVAEIMSSGGIRAIWNFSPVTLDVPDDVIVQNEDLYAGLASLTQKLAAHLNVQRNPKQKG